MIKELKGKFKEIFGVDEALRVYFAPGRVNLIGEHTDYNGGHVFPCALTMGTYALTRKRQDKKVRAFSENFGELGVIEFDLEDLIYREEHHWANYPKGVFKAIKDEGYELGEGFDILFYGNIPNGSGLSSSASIEVVTAVAIRDNYGLDIDNLEIARICQRAENEFIKVNCGIMDQFAIAMGKRDCAMLLDTNTLTYEYAPIVLENSSIVISNTNKKRTLGDSKYNERRSECDRALEDLQSMLNVKALGELKEEEFNKHKHLIKNSTDRKRAEHAVCENIRTLKAVKALKEGRLESFGRLMKESHESLRDLYEVTGKELDTLVALALEQEGVIGSRMTGAGFGGCTVSIVKKAYVEDFIKNLGEKYNKAIGYEASFYVADIGDGAGRLE